MIKSKVRFVDFKSLVLIIILLIPSLIFKLFSKKIMIVSERRLEARDNGYWFFKFMREKHPKFKAFYVISRNSFDFKKVACIGNVINFGSLKHYFYYLSCSIRASSHIDSDSPNSRVTNFLERHHIIRNKFVFLQHGITKDKISFGYYSVTRARLFICSGLKEYSFCKEEFGYPQENVVLTGFARYDNLYSNQSTKRQILIMPTWRSWLSKTNESGFLSSDYYEKYQSLLNNQKLISLLEKYDYTLLFYPHYEMQKFIHLFSSASSSVIIADQSKYDVQELLKQSSLLITDYSSVAFDFCYMFKPVIYYQFDYSNYRKMQHPSGYFSYVEDAFGPIEYNENDVVDYIHLMLQSSFNIEEIYKRRVNSFFAFFDNHNCERIYDEIVKVSTKKHFKQNGEKD